MICRLAIAIVVAELVAVSLFGLYLLVDWLDWWWVMRRHRSRRRRRT